MDLQLGRHKRLYTQAADRDVGLYEADMKNPNRMTQRFLKMHGATP